MNRLPETGDGTVTSWIPITTAHPQRPGCSENYWSYVANTIAAWDPGYGISVSDNECLPKPVTTWWDQDRLGSNPSTTISLGPLTCPDAFYTATTSVKDASSTLVACCPSGYTFVDFFDRGTTGECYSKAEAGKVINYAIRDESQNWQTSSTTLESATTIAGIQVNGWVFASQTSAPTGGATGSDSATCAPASDSTSGCAASNDGLTAGAKAGIGVGVALGVVGLATLAAGLFMMRRRRPTKNAYTTAELPVVSEAPKPPEVAKPQQPTVELYASHYPHAELSADMDPHSHVPNPSVSPPSASTATYLPPGDFQSQGWNPDNQPPR